MRNTSPELLGKTPDDLIAEGLGRSAIGPQNASRILAAHEQGMLKLGEYSLDTLLEVNQSSPTHFDGITRFAFPELRVASDFEVGDQYRIINPGGQQKPQEVIVAGTEHPDEIDGEGYMFQPSIVHLGRSLDTNISMELAIPSNWPGLVPLELSNLLRDRERSRAKLSSQLRSGLGRIFFMLSFFNDGLEEGRAEHENFRESIYRSLRWHNLSVPNRMR